MSDLHWTEVDGVTTIWTETPGPLHAELLFRSGRVDETLTTSGHTHLIEHLALEALGDNSQQHNGFVGPTVCGFLTTGTPDDVSAFLLGISRSLCALPADRLTAEKAVLEAEDATQSSGGPGSLLTCRYGARGHGLVGLPQVGVRSATIQQLRSLADRNLTRQNAVLWLSGPPPGGLRLELHDGHKIAVPQLAPLPLGLPGWIVDDTTGGMAVGAVAPRNAAAAIFRQIAEDRLRYELRSTRALSYSPWISYNLLDADTSHLVLYADCDEPRRAELAEAFGQVFEGFTKIGEAEVLAARKQLLEEWIGTLAPPPDTRRVDEVQRAAHDFLLDREHKPLEQLVEESASVNEAEVGEFVTAIRQTAVIAVPGDAVLMPWMGAQIPVSINPPVTGRMVRALNPVANPETLVIGPDGVSLRLPDGSANTVRYSSLAAALRFDDGSLHLVDKDALLLIVDPSAWRKGKDICREIIEHVAPNLVLDGGPSRTAFQAAHNGPPASGAPRSPVRGWVLAVLGGLGVPFSTLVVASAFADPEIILSEPLELAFIVLILAVPLIASIAMLVAGVRILRRA